MGRASRAGEERVRKKELAAGEGTRGGMWKKRNNRFNDWQKLKRGVHWSWDGEERITQRIKEGGAAGGLGGRGKKNTGNEWLNFITYNLEKKGGDVKATRNSRGK